MTSRAYGARSPRSHYDVILSVTSFVTELVTPTVTDERIYVTNTLPRLIYIKIDPCECVHKLSKSNVIII